MHPAFSLLALAVLTVCVGKARSAAVLESPEERVALLELFTSEGCSSCPPAEAWLGGLKDQSGLWKEFVPVAFHVDYWDSLGWPDRFASAEFTQRQRAYGEEWNASTIYTPEFVLNGAEWRRSGALPAPSKEKAGRLRVTVSDDGTVDVSFIPAGRVNGPLTVALVPLGQGVGTEVRRGENAGKILQHNFLALGFVQSEMVASAAGKYTAQLVLPEKAAAPLSALAVWVHSPQSLAPLQAVGGWLEK